MALGTDRTDGETFWVMLASSHVCGSDAREGVSAQQEKMRRLWGHLQRTDANSGSQPPTRPGSSKPGGWRDFRV